MAMPELHGGPFKPEAFGLTLAALLPENAVVAEDAVTSGRALLGPVEGRSYVVDVGLPIASVEAKAHETQPPAAIAAIAPVIVTTMPTAGTMPWTRAPMAVGHQGVDGALHAPTVIGALFCRTSNVPPASASGTWLRTATCWPWRSVWNDT